MPDHVLIVGTDRNLSGVLRTVAPDVVTSVIARSEFLPRLRNFHRHDAVFGLRHDGPDAQWIELAELVDRHRSVTRVASFEDRDQARAALIGQALGLPVHAPQTVAAVNDKAEMRRVLGAAGVDTTPCLVSSDATHLRAFLAEHGPCFVKPATGEASGGVSRVAEPHELDRALDRARRASQDERVMIEPEHDGPEISVETLSEDGSHEVVAVVRKTSDPGTHVEVGHVVPAGLDAAAHTAVVDHVVEVLTALGVRNGPAHTELRLTAHGPRVIETHLRLAGDGIPDLVRDVTGADLEEAQVRQVLGQRVLDDVRRTVRRTTTRPGAAIWFVIGTRSGRLDTIEGIEDARGRPGVVEVSQLLSPGARVRRPRSSEDRLAYVRCVGEDGDQAEARARQAAESLGVRLEAEAEASSR